MYSVSTHFLEFMENIIRKIRTYYPVSDEALEALVCPFERSVFPSRTTIIHAGKLDRKVWFVEKGIIAAIFANKSSCI